MKNRSTQFGKIAFIGNYVPRRCGIATFTTDICESVAREAPEVECVTAAMNDTVEGYDYPDRVRFEVAQNDLDEYRQLADFLNLGRVDMLCIRSDAVLALSLALGGRTGDPISRSLADVQP